MENEYQCIGDLIKEKLKENDRTVRWLAKKTGYTCSNIYKALKLVFIHTELLDRISRVLDYDFYTYYSNLLHKNEHDLTNS
jgi:hypothetical protein